MALTKDVLVLTTGYDGTHNGCNGTQEDMMALTKDVMALTTGCNDTALQEFIF